MRDTRQLLPLLPLLLLLLTEEYQKHLPLLLLLPLRQTCLLAAASPFLPSSSLTRSPLRRPGSADTVYIYIYVCMYMYVCMYVYIYIFAIVSYIHTCAFYIHIQNYKLCI